MSINIEDFLVGLLQRVREGKLSQEMVKSVEELSMKYEYEQKVLNNMKYYILGWYAYTVMGWPTTKIENDDSEIAKCFTLGYFIDQNIAIVTREN